MKEPALPWGRGLPSGRVKALSFPEEGENREGAESVARGQIRAMVTPSSSPRRLITARTHGPWECSGECLGPQNHPMIS